MALRVPLERSKPVGGMGAEGGKKPSVLFLPVLLAWPPSFRSIGHALPPSLLLHTHPINTQAHMSKSRNQNIASPADTGGGDPGHLGSACRPSGVEIKAVKPLKVAAASTASLSSVRRGSLFTAPGLFLNPSLPMNPVINKHNAILITSAIFTPKGFLTPHTHSP